MYYIDYHHHSNHSFDSKAIMMDICENAIRKGINEICFTEHFSVNPNAPTYGHMNWPTYLEDINKCRISYQDQLIIKLGIELCEPHLLREQYKTVLAPIPFDYILGSVHNLHGLTLRKYMNAHPDEDIYLTYFKEVLELVTYADIDVLAHFDLMKRYAHPTRGIYHFPDYQEIITTILTTAIKRNIGLEINTSGWRTSLNESLPSIEVLALYKKLGGEILTIGSDSHRKDDVGADFMQALNLAKKAGFTAYYKYEKRKPIRIDM
ncbi:histidinol-phosphatase [Niallia circulans]|uniref:histidinol-phosphatase HisJ family protein n=1 Tax=Niallia TaxID=2837506 RepID=UPI000BA6B174|nr:histidinol-phosphatase HisJ family protein [Niallia circulans]PAD86008.1 histidinol-phosphatase [Niallia circulans]PAE13640.1 histidinol-phosphatase [Niallia circulans]